VRVAAVAVAARASLVSGDSLPPAPSSDPGGPEGSCGSLVGATGRRLNFSARARASRRASWSHAW